ncbi:uncharacterized protein LOC111261046 isoform X1 [Varroa jacobsoni]|uniref:uncharacterized protein LOC111261046 isoform X1 n=1 Tax=Varroa jacobsoni TaxID=62625 RepID=UPI000BF92D5E|nr:uncharacterized protein LOC111261046 isoform X1 [Varroa jacobsoni]
MWMYTPLKILGRDDGWFTATLVTGLAVLGGVVCSEAEPSGGGPDEVVFIGFGGTVIGCVVLTITAFLLTVGGCLCCSEERLKRLFGTKKRLVVSSGSCVSDPTPGGAAYAQHSGSSPSSCPSELTLFPHSAPPLSLDVAGLCGDHEVCFEPLPKIYSRVSSANGKSTSVNSRGNKGSSLEDEKGRRTSHEVQRVSLNQNMTALRPAYFAQRAEPSDKKSNWFDDPSANFPRHQLQYLSELGTGWFGQVVAGVASSFGPVAVKILRADASPTDHIHFLQQVEALKISDHPNIVRLLGRCLESDPFLLILEQGKADLKTYIITQPSQLETASLLRFAHDIASATEYLHKRGFIVTDLAARNCLLMNDLRTIKLGDYGLSIEKFPQDYYAVGDTAIPLRWSAPETFRVMETAVELLPLSRSANVWSFGVLLWELAKGCQRPLDYLTDEQFLQQIVVEQKWDSEYALNTNLIGFNGLISKCCSLDEARRPTTTELVIELGDLMFHEPEECSLGFQRSTSVHDMLNERPEKVAEMFKITVIDDELTEHLSSVGLPPNYLWGSAAGGVSMAAHSTVTAAYGSLGGIGPLTSGPPAMKLDSADLSQLESSTWKIPQPDELNANKVVVEGQSEASTLANELMPMSEYITASNGDLSTLSNISHPLQTLPHDDEDDCNGNSLGRHARSVNNTATGGAGCHDDMNENGSHCGGLESDTLDMFSEPTSLVNELDNILDARSDGTITPQAEPDAQGYADDDYHDQMELELPQHKHTPQRNASKFLSGRPTFQLNINVGSTGLPDVIPPSNGEPETPMTATSATTATTISTTLATNAATSTALGDNPLHLSNDVLMKFQRISSDTS